MECQNEISHAVAPGDTLYKLAQQYKTTVTVIARNNPNIDPYNLRVGERIVICPGNTYQENYYQDKANYRDMPQNAAEPRHMGGEGSGYPHKDEPELRDQMRKAWMEHVFWTRLFIISVMEGLKDLDLTTERLLRNPNDMADVFGKYYGDQAAKQIAALMTEHLSIGGELVKALKAGNNSAVNDANRRWYKNADDMAKYFSTLNPYYKYDELRDMLYRHLSLTSKEAAMRLSGDYQADIDAFGMIEKQALDMADYFSRGIMNMKA